MNYKKCHKNWCRFIVAQSNSETWPHKMNQRTIVLPDVDQNDQGNL